MSGHIENEERYVRPGVFSIPVEPVILPCEECHSEDYPNYRYDMVILTGVLCKRCLDEEIENFRINCNQI
jgi:hypothetical protein